MKSYRLLGIHLADISHDEAVERAREGGLFLAPSAPGLCELAHDTYYQQALRDSDLNLADSGLAILLMRLLGLGILQRTSGLGFLRQLLRSEWVKNAGNSFWVMPNKVDMERNVQWLQAQGCAVSLQDCYIAPLYSKSGAVEDHELLSMIKEHKPLAIFICTGSGNQEKLGFWLKQNLGYRPLICCIGAAIGFLSGSQVKIPAWADRFCLGWLFRCVSNPRQFIPRYLSACRLIPLVIRYRMQSPLPRQV
jgi:N-acetylglucosaminyldiphosphoundecaprenol N-acetyl-beta-D-mannosaminyltransferase